MQAGRRTRWRISMAVEDTAELGFRCRCSRRSEMPRIICFQPGKTNDSITKICPPSPNTLYSTPNGERFAAKQEICSQGSDTTPRISRQRRPSGERVRFRGKVRRSSQEANRSAVRMIQLGWWLANELNNSASITNTQPQRTARLGRNVSKEKDKGNDQQNQNLNVLRT
jgi:hypothetical protein